MCLSVKHDPKGCSGHTRLRNTEVINSFAELIRAFTMLCNTQREQFVVFPKHNCVGVSFVFHFYLIHSEPFHWKNGATGTLTYYWWKSKWSSHFGKLWKIGQSLIKLNIYLLYDLTECTKYIMHNHIHKTLCKTLETTKTSINRALINRVWCSYLMDYYVTVKNEWGLSVCTDMGQHWTYWHAIYFISLSWCAFTQQTLIEFLFCATQRHILGDMNIHYFIQQKCLLFLPSLNTGPGA